MKLLLFVAFGVFTVFAEEPSQVLKDFSVGNKHFTGDVYREMLKSNSGNFLVCPLSVETVLALVHSGAKGRTAQQLSSGLHLPESSETIQEIFTQLAPTLKSNEFYNLSSANKVYIKDDFKISDTFKSTAVNAFGAEIQNIDFGKSKTAALEINRWVEDQTHDKIKNLIQSSDVDASTIAVLVNAMFFQGTWEEEFSEYGTQKKPFHLNSKEHVETDMMRVNSIFKYYESNDLHAKFLELPYKGNGVTMTIVLPFEVDGLGALETRITETLISPNFTHEQVNVQFPKFKIESTIPFNPILEALGIKDAFQNNADFSGIGANKDKLSISKVFQKAFIEVDEKGTTAAAATFLGIAAQAGYASINPPKEFVADHPFIFYLKNRSTILFIGRYVSVSN